MNPEDDYIFDFVILPSSTLSVAPTSSIHLVLAAQSGLPVSETIFTEQIINISPDAVTISTQSSSELSNSKTASQTSSSQPLAESGTTGSVDPGSTSPITETLPAETTKITSIYGSTTATTTSQPSSTHSHETAGATISAIASPSALTTASKAGIAIAGAPFALIVVTSIFLLRWLRRRRCQSYTTSAGPKHSAAGSNSSDNT